MGWRALTDLTSGKFVVAKSHDAKLGEISYSGEAGSHIKVFFPPEKPGQLEDPSSSSLWSACPAAVYQIVLDRTLHASVAVNFENCVKCETCWRIEPAHVDWSRFGSHRLVYEVYSGADEALRRIIAERRPGPGPEIEPSYWTATAGDGWPGASIEMPEAVKAALAGAYRAIALAGAKCTELNANVWHGPRVLEPGQVEWYSSAIEYCAALADKAAAAATAEPLESWLVESDLGAAHVDLLGLKRDLETVSARSRARGCATLLRRRGRRAADPRPSSGGPAPRARPVVRTLPGRAGGGPGGGVAGARVGVAAAGGSAGSAARVRGRRVRPRCDTAAGEWRRAGEGRDRALACRDACGTR